MSTLPPYITTQGLRLWNGATAEFFGRADGSEVDLRQGDSGKDQHWRPVSRDELVAGMTRPTAEGAAVEDLSRVVVVVDSGRGKTSLLRRLAMELGRHPEFSVCESLAVRLEVNELPPTTDNHWASDEDILDRLGEVLFRGNAELKSLLEKAAAANGGNVQRQMRGWLSFLCASGRLLLLLDALDQARGPQIETLRRMLTGELPDWTNCRFILTGRRPAIQNFNDVDSGGVFEDPRNGWRIVQLDSFSDTDQQDHIGLERWNKLPPAARTLLSTPRVCEYVRGLTDAEAATLKTEADVYYGSLRRMLSAGLMAESAKSFGPGVPAGSLPVESRRPRDRRLPGGRAVLEAPPKQIDAAMQLLSAIAFEMICLPNSDTKNLRNEVTSDEYDTFLNRVRARVQDAPSCGWQDAGKFENDVKLLYDINAAKFEFWFFDTHNSERLTELRFRDATVKEFLAAHWVAKYGTQEDAQQIEQWIYLPDRPQGRTNTNPQFAWFWRYLSEMPRGGRSATSWLTAIAPLFNPNANGVGGSGSASGSTNVSDPTGAHADGVAVKRRGRSCEMMYRAWPTLTAYRDAGNEQAQSIVRAFLSEFPLILNTVGSKQAKIAAELVPESVLEQLVLDKQWLASIRPEADAPAYVRCPPLQVEQAELAELQRRGDGLAGASGLYELDCHRFLRGTDADTRDRDGGTFHRWGREDPRHAVRVTPFWMKATHVTRAEFALFDPAHERAWENELNQYAPEPDCPVLYVSWYQSWCLATWCGMGMPTEAQFEFGVRAGHDGKGDLFPQGDTASSFQINCDGNYPFAGSQKGPYLNRTVPVRCQHPLQDDRPIENMDYKPNEWGVWHPVGQAWVWCGDWFDEEEYQRHEQGLVVNPMGPESGTRRVLRGGAWSNYPASCRSAFRVRVTPDSRDNYSGLRLVCVVCVRTP